MDTIVSPHDRHCVVSLVERVRDVCSSASSVRVQSPPRTADSGTMRVSPELQFKVEVKRNRTPSVRLVYIMNDNEFEGAVRDLLRLQGWLVTPEVLLGHKKVDCYAEKVDSLGTLQRVAVECKAWQSPLSQNDITHIHVNYHPLIETNLVDIILVLTLTGLSPSAETYLRSTRTLRHLTYAQLLNTVIDFRVHLQGLVAGFGEHDIAKHYIEQDFVEGEETLEEHLLQWIDSPDYRPVAILAGYGYGKTTLAKRLAYVLAKRCIADPTARIPVVIALATIASDQTLEGLLGRQFTSVTLCQNYNFQLFTALNARGRFVFFLDGFDEMKRTMSWESLLFNLTQLNQLVAPLSKVVLLGRPSAFLTGEEQDEALHGRVRRLGLDRHVPGWPNYRELHLRPFSRQQVTTFVQQYLDNLPQAKTNDDERRHRLTKYLGNLESPQGKRLLDLASRPVQLGMLMELLPEYTGPIERLTVAMLYEAFIDLLLRRESAKPARAAFTPEQRLRFAARVAYWMWQDDQRSDVDVRKVPEALFDGYLDNVSRDVQPLDIKRDLLNGGFLDRKPPNIFFFPHRSFQEYLVAEHLVAGLRDKSDLVDCPYLTPEARSFFIELAGRKAILQLRKRWTDRAGISKILQDLINAACAYYGLEPLSGAQDDERAPQDVKQLALEKSDELLRQLEVGGVLTVKRERLRVRSAKTKRTTKHRRAGVTPKHKYRSE
jgi:hypothetical protein